MSAARDGRYNVARERNGKALADALPDSSEKAGLLTTVGRTDQTIAAADEKSRAESARRAMDAYGRAIAVAKAVGDPRAESYATGYLANLYEERGAASDTPAIEALANRAVFLAKKAGDRDSLYRWEWLNARLLRRDPARRDAAIDAYTRATRTLLTVQTDKVLGFGNGDTRLSFRKETGPVYYELADLLLRRAADARRSRDQQRQDLVAARDTIELLKGGELAEYLKDPCQNTLPQRKIGDLPPGSAVFYVIPLKDRTELLLELPKHPGETGENLVRVDPASPATAAEVEATVATFREHLERRANHRYRVEAERLYDWLIRPAEGLLKENGIDTLVFVPDGILRTVPMAALYDGKDFLIQHYAVAVTPGLTLTESESASRRNPKLLINALSKSVSGFPALENVPAEVRNIRRTFGPGREAALIDEKFLIENVRGEIASGGNQFSIVHIASHGQFRGDVNDTYLLTYDTATNENKRMTIDVLKGLIQPSKYGGAGSRPVDLLTLSACQTAAGDDKAALGLAGVAIGAARSAVASLWCLNDNSSVELISEFYRQLASDPNVSKAKALQRAQVKLLEDEDFSHPLYWAPYLVIGNWQ